ncbi:MAG TPA: oligoribonuclease [Polyangiaceae bacterium]|nr:oligoribonuclease [Polyangiaceae bacterium]
MARPNDATPQRTQYAQNLVWLDLEMTGLELESHVILQAALIVTDAELRPLEEFCCDIWQPEAELAKMSPFVRDMHEKTGLLARVRQSMTDTRRAEQQLLEIVTGWCPYGAVLCGNSIWQDRRFVDRFMPGLAAYLTYRLLDVSSVKVLARTWYGPSAVYAKPTAGEHDALVDIRNSIAELAHYRRTLFRAV